MPQRSESTEKALDWVFKITTALAIPALVWSFKLSTQVAVLEQKFIAQEKEIVQMRSDFKEQINAGNEKLSKIYETLIKRESP